MPSAAATFTDAGCRRSKARTVAASPRLAASTSGTASAAYAADAIVNARTPSIFRMAVAPARSARYTTSSRPVLMPNFSLSMPNLLVSSSRKLASGVSFAAT